MSRWTHAQTDGIIQVELELMTENSQSEERMEKIEGVIFLRRTIIIKQKNKEWRTEKGVGIFGEGNSSPRCK